MSAEISAMTILLEAIRRTPRVMAPNGKEVVYASPQLESVSDTTCWLCGGSTNGQGRPVGQVVNAYSFTDTPRARGLQSASVCGGCVLMFAYHRPLRNFSVLADRTGLRHPARSEWRTILQEPPEPPFIACLAVSGQKYLVFKAAVNWNRERFEVLLEETPITVEPGRLAVDLPKVDALYRYFTKDEIRTGRYSSYRILKCGPSSWEELEGQVKPLRQQSRWFELLLYLSIKPPPH